MLGLLAGARGKQASYPSDSTGGNKMGTIIRALIWLAMLPAAVIAGILSLGLPHR
jgi:hypothetical protein